MKFLEVVLEIVVVLIEVLNPHVSVLASAGVALTVWVECQAAIVTISVICTSIMYIRISIKFKCQFPKYLEFKFTQTIFPYIDLANNANNKIKS